MKHRIWNYFTQNPVSWQVSADGSRMIGHMVLQRNVDSEDVLGLRVRGGQVLPHNEKGAIVEQVQRGSIADQEGHIRPGKYHPFLFGTFWINLSVLSLDECIADYCIRSHLKDILVRCRVLLAPFFHTIILTIAVFLSKVLNTSLTLPAFNFSFPSTRLQVMKWWNGMATRCVGNPRRTYTIL